MEKLKNPKFRSTYLGDGLYGAHDGYQFWLMACNGIEILDEVALESETLFQFLKYVEAISNVTIKVTANPISDEANLFV